MKISIISSVFVWAAAAFFTGASAFAPPPSAAATTRSTAVTSSSSSRSAAAASFANEIGAQAPLGFFDPLGLVADGDQAKFDRLRYVEIKHGRICMLGVVGYLVTAAGIRLPGLISYDGTKFSDLPAGWAGSFQTPLAGAVQVLLFVGFLEIAFMKSVPGTGNEFVGDFRNGFIDFGWDTFDAATKREKRAIELNQGRAAMMGLLGLMVHDQLGVPVLPGV